MAQGQINKLSCYKSECCEKLMISEINESETQSSTLSVFLFAIKKGYSQQFD